MHRSKSKRRSSSSRVRNHAVDPLEPRLLLAYASIVQDINPTTDMLAPEQFTVVGSQAFFAGRGVDGADTELWKTDGTTAGTVLVREIVPGLGGGDPTQLTDVGGTLFFSARDTGAGYELWKSDGTAAGTVRVKDIRPGTGDSMPGNLTAVGNTLYFTATDDAGGTELWKSDGTDAGTVRVKDIYSGSTGSNPQYLVAYNGALLFSADDGSWGRELWRSDGTAAGTTRVKDITPGSGSSGARHLVPFAGGVYFAAVSGGSQYVGDLYRSDGTAAGTVHVADISYLGSSGSTTDYGNIAKIVPSGDRLYFLAGSALNGKYDLWGSDGTTAGTTVLLGGGPFYNYSVIAPAGQRSLVFTHATSTAGAELWMSDGTAAGTGMLKDVLPGTASGMSGGAFGRVGNTVYFAPNRFDGLTELWKSDLTPAGTVKVTNVDPAGAALGPFAALGQKLLFTGFRYIDQGDLYVSDGTAAGTKRIGATAPGNASSMKDYTFSNAWGRSGETMYFVASDGLTGREVWRTRAGATPGTLAGASLVSDLAPNGFSSDPDYFLTGNDGSVYFTANTPALGTELYRIPPGTNTAAQLVSDFLPGAASSAARAVGALGDWVYITAQDAAGVYNLWRYNPSTGAAPVKVLTATGKAITRPGSMTVMGGYAYFSASGLDQYGSSVGAELWRTDGASNTAELVKDIHNGSDSFPALLTAVGNTLYFVARDSVGGNELWKSDGTDAGTVPVADITPGSSGTSFSQMSVLNGVLYFAADPGTAGAEDRLWRSDGTPAGTYELAPLNIPRHMSALGGQLYFVASDAQGRAAFRYDPADPGAAPVRLTPATSGGLTLTPTALVVAGTRAYVVANTGTGRGDHYELWQTDGTPAGTAKVRDVQPVVSPATTPGLSSYWASGWYALAANSTHLFFPAWRPETGLEPHALPLADPAGAIRGVVFDDRDRDGVRDANEPGAAGRTVFVDFDNDGAPDADEPTATTDPGGNYVLSALEAGTYAVRQVVPAGWQATGAAGPRSVTVAAAAVDGVNFGATDVAPPVVVSGNPAADRPASALRVTFGEDVGASLGGGDLRLENLTASTTVETARIAVSFDVATLTATFSFPGYPGGVLPDGNYRATVLAAGVTDATGNPAAADFAFDFFVLAGDANRDRVVNFADLLTLAKNYNGANKVWSEGDFNGDGAVNFADLLALAKSYNKALPAPNPTPTVKAAPAIAASAGAVLDTGKDKPKPVFSTTPVKKPAPAKPKAAARR
jgi:ELWxxDGT repeat protein